MAGAALRSGRDRPAAAPVDAAATAPSEQEQVERNRICGKQCNAMLTNQPMSRSPPALRFFRCLCSDLGNEPIGVSAFDPIKNASSCSLERRHIFRQQ